MFDPLIAGVLIITYRNADGIVCHPDTVTIDIEIINAVAVHGIIAAIVGYNIGLTFVGIHIQLIYSGTICGY